MATFRTVASCIATGNTNIPLRSTSKCSGETSPTSLIHIQNSSFYHDDINNKWKIKYEESEVKRKLLLTQNEKDRRNIHNLEKKNAQIQVKYEEMETELFETNENLSKLTTVSKSLFKEYDALKNQYEVETGAMDRALSDASQWYRENKVLRRRTMVMKNDSTVDEEVDAYDPDSTTDSDLDNIRKSVKLLSSEVAYLQAELNAAKLLEFETTEANVQLTQELEAERKRNQKLQHELNDLNQAHNQMLRVSNMMKKEIEDFKEMVRNQKSNAVTLRKEADDYKRERNVLAHQSTILLQGLSTNDEGIDPLLLIEEMEKLKSSLEDERNKYVSKIASLQERLEEQYNNSDIEILEERLKLVESELEYAIKRAHKAELASTSEANPPPPPPLPLSATPIAPLRIKKIFNPNSTESLKNTSENKTSAVGGVNDDIINQIKGGFFTLRKAQNQSNNSKNERETPKVVNEMLNILGSLRRTSRNKAGKSQGSSLGNVHL